MRPAEVVRRGAAYLDRHGVGSPEANAERLLLSVLGAGRTEVLARIEPLSPAEARAYGRALCRRCTGTPLQHLTGEQGFRRLVLEVRPGVFVPRPETEVVAGVALDRIAGRPAPAVVDLCTGSGTIALAIADERRDARVWATDLAPEAVDLARANAARLGLAVDVRRGDLFEPLPAALRGSLDLVVANPPYVASEAAAELPAEVRADPPLAVFGGPELAGRIARAARPWLRPGGALVLEIEASAGAAVRRLAADAGYADVAVRSDLTGRDRVLSATWPDGA
ncbi:MAG TPA: peptide chain release factor N(5)-glutamine methyltransferase [Actinomycetota bacterium]|nr:peptide chain release factor N(5)-glutamine methyltransferase [Actinomycetota bacterium]